MHLLTATLQPTIKVVIYTMNNEKIQKLALNNSQLRNKPPHDNGAQPMLKLPKTRIRLQRETHILGIETNNYDRQTII